MNFIPADLPGVIIIEPDVYRDTRGFFLETYHAQKYGEAGIPTSFVQDNHSRSVCGSLRGLHAQLIQPQGKLVRVIDGEIFDVAVDIRRGSPKFGTWLGVFLSSENFRQMYIPPGFAHGFCVVSAVAEVEYKCTDFYYPGGDLTISWNDPEIGISWPIRDPMLSEKDGNAASLKDLLDRLPLYEDI